MEPGRVNRLRGTTNYSPQAAGGVPALVQGRHHRPRLGSPGDLAGVPEYPRTCRHPELLGGTRCGIESCGLLGQGLVFQVYSHRFTTWAGRYPRFPPLWCTPPGRPSTPTHPRSDPVIRRSEHPSRSPFVIHHSGPETVQHTPHQQPLLDKHCRYDSMAPPPCHQSKPLTSGNFEGSKTGLRPALRCWS